MDKDKRYFVYMLHCADDTFYTGYTVDSVEKRLAVHNAGKGGKYTRGRRPLTLVYAEECKTRSDAMKRECQLKAYQRWKKEQMAKAFCAQQPMVQTPCKQQIMEEKLME